MSHEYVLKPFTHVFILLRTRKNPFPPALARHIVRGIGGHSGMPLDRWRGNPDTGFMSSKPSPITESVVDGYELEYDFADTKTKGNVIVSVLGNTETHNLRVGTTTIAEYRKAGKDDTGTTCLFGTKRKIKLGSGNLLAGALFRFHQLRLRRNEAKGAKP